MKPAASLLRRQAYSRRRLQQAAKRWLALVSATEGSQGFAFEAPNRDGILLRAQVTVTYQAAESEPTRRLSLGIRLASTMRSAASRFASHQQARPDPLGRARDGRPRAAVGSHDAVRAGRGHVGHHARLPAGEARSRRSPRPRRELMRDVLAQYGVDVGDPAVARTLLALWHIAGPRSSVDNAMPYLNAVNAGALAAAQRLEVKRSRT